MIKVYALLPRRADVSEAQFHEHWSTVHREHALRITRLRRYVQAHRIPGEIPGLATAPYDGVPEVWYDDLESALGMNTDPNYTEYAHRDEPNFIDMDGIRWVMTEFWMLEPPGEASESEPGVKVIMMVRRRSGASVEEFQEQWLPAVSRIAHASDVIRRAGAALTLKETYGDTSARRAPADSPEYDGFAELWWPDAESFREAWARDGERVLGALGEVADVPRSHGMLCEELRVIWPEDPLISADLQPSS